MTGSGADSSPGYVGSCVVSWPLGVLKSRSTRLALGSRKVRDRWEEPNLHAST